MLVQKGSELPDLDFLTNNDRTIPSNVKKILERELEKIEQFTQDCIDREAGDEINIKALESYMDKDINSRNDHSKLYYVNSKN